MIRSARSVATASAHLVGPGKLKIHNRRLAFSNGSSRPVRLDPAGLETIVCYGNVGISDEAFRVLFHHGVHVSWLSANGSRLRGRLAPLDDSLSQLRLLQYRAATDPEVRLPLARDVVCGKLRSQLDAATHYHRHGQKAMREFCTQTKARLKQAPQTSDLDVLRGMEGVNTKEWFAQFKLLFDAWWQAYARAENAPSVFREVDEFTLERVAELLFAVTGERRRNLYRQFGKKVGGEKTWRVNGTTLATLSARPRPRPIDGSRRPAWMAGEAA